MKKKLLLTLSAFLLTTGLVACNTPVNPDPQPEPGPEPEDNYYYVNFYYNFPAEGEGLPENFQQKVKEGETATKPADPTFEGYTFAGWKKDGELYDFATPVTGGFTLVGSWQKDADPEPENPWPAEALAAVVAVLAGEESTTVIPAFEGATGYMSDEGASLPQSFTFIALTDNVNADQDYAEIVEAAGWNVEYSDDVSMYIAIAPAKDITMGFLYSEQYAGLQIILIAYEDPSQWPADFAAQAVAYWAGEESTTVIPSFEADEFYTSMDYVEQGYGIIIQGAREDNGIEDEYAALLEGLGWTVEWDDNQEWYVAVSPAKDLQVCFYYYNGSFTLQIYNYQDPSQWPEATAAEIVAVLAGEESTTVIPEFEADTYSVITDYYQQYGCIIIAGVTENANIEDEYKAVLEAAGWTVTYDAQNEAYNAISPAQDIEIFFYLSNGTFYAQIYSHAAPLTEWPAEFAAEYIAYFGGEDCETVLPAIEAEEYYTNADYVSDGYVYIGVAGDQSILTDYLAILVANGWTVSDEPNTYGYYIAISPDEKIELEIDYKSDKLRIFLEAYVAPAPIEWPAEEIAAKLDAIVPGTETVIPSYDWAVTGPHEIYSSTFYICGDQEGMALYAAKLEDEGWKVTYDASTNQYTAISPNKDVALTIYWSTTYNQIVIKVAKYIAPHACVWPADEVAAKLDSIVPGTETVIPAFDLPANGASEDVEVLTSQIWIYCEKTQLVNYIAILQANGWTVSYNASSGRYIAISPDGDVKLEVLYSSSYKQVAIYIFANYKEFPADFAAQYVTYFAGEESETVIPAFDDAANYSTNTSYVSSYGVAMINCTTPDATSEAAYAGVLEEADWTVTYDEENEGYNAISPNEDIALFFYYYNGDLVIQISKYVAPILDFPAEFAANAVETIAPGSETVIPSDLEGVTNYATADSYQSGGYYVIQAYGESTLLTDYLALLEEAGWAISDTTNSYGLYECVSPAGDIMLEVGYSSYYGYLIIYIESPSIYEASVRWDADAVASLVDAVVPGTETVIPEFSIPTTVDPEYYDGQIWVNSDEEGMTAYIAILEDAGWQVTWSEEYTSYLCVSPNGDVLLQIYYDAEWQQIAIYIYNASVLGGE